MDFKDKLKQFRLKSNLTQEELAKKLDVTRTRITDTESGRVQGNLKFITNLSKISMRPLAYWIDGTFEDEYKPYEALDVLVDNLIDAGLIEENKDVDDNVAVLLLNMLKKETNLKIRIKKEMKK